MTFRQTISVFSLVVLPFTSVACGRHERGHHGHHMMMMGRGGMRHMHHSMGDPVAQLLDHQAALKLTPAQVNSLISIDEKMIADNKPLRDRLMALRPPMSADRDKKPDSATIAARMPQRDSAGVVFQQMRENRWRATNAAYGQLTDEQMSMVARVGSGGRPGGFPADSAVAADLAAECGTAECGTAGPVLAGWAVDARAAVAQVDRPTVHRVARVAISSKAGVTRPSVEGPG